MLCHVLILICVNSVVVGNTINSKEQYISRHVGENVTLTCEYSTSSNGPYLSWYRQYSNQIEYLLYRGAKSYSSMKHDGNYGKGKFDSIANDTSTQLIIFSLTVEDSALYLCALSDAAQW
ncbi:hypothetical protein XELAEV_18007254mg [Xenopus laevis]|uniref:Ig-like domain-containing protein n=1 Tax=Xenopus laevis TaxID=8355 RepID=A0A974I4B1_XENLA|nr:hypothetical protein XELAEV_18007254mg [Xenopus laevis]